MCQILPPLLAVFRSQAMGSFGANFGINSHSCYISARALCENIETGDTLRYIH